VVLAATTVQGERAPAEICAALSRLARLHQRGEELDLIIVARGGGSEQDLAVFNDEQVARAFFGCPVPIVSAIGHETDLTLVDFVADLRAPTPSAAAELVAPDADVLRDLVSELARRAENALQQQVQEARYELRLARDRVLSRSPAAELARRRVEVRAELRRGLTSLEQAVQLAREQLRGRALQLEALSPERTLGRGYAVCTLASGEVLRSISQANPGDKIDITIGDGLVHGRAEALVRRAEPGSGTGSQRDGHGQPVANV
jgi:exodeoxyribonuclease VII large subunit